MPSLTPCRKIRAFLLPFSVSLSDEWGGVTMLREIQVLVATDESPSRFRNDKTQYTGTGITIITGIVSRILFPFRRSLDCCSQKFSSLLLIPPPPPSNNMSGSYKTGTFDCMSDTDTCVKFMFCAPCMILSCSGNELVTLVRNDRRIDLYFLRPASCALRCARVAALSRFIIINRRPNLLSVSQKNIFFF